MKRLFALALFSAPAFLGACTPSGSSEADFKAALEKSLKVRGQELKTFHLEKGAPNILCDGKEAYTVNYTALGLKGGQFEDKEIVYMSHDCLHINSDGTLRKSTASGGGPMLSLCGNRPAGSTTPLGPGC